MIMTEEPNWSLQLNLGTIIEDNYSGNQKNYVKKGYILVETRLIFKVFDST